ncbi:MAG: dihydrofolate synthase, partial [Phenylobacterium zucineum]
ELLGDPQRSYRVIHVTGTNGKTSTTRFIERILRELGLRTGRFTSPHLVRLNERMAIDGEPVADEVLYEVWQDIRPILEIVDAELEAAGESKLTFFEALAVLGFAVFADAPVDVLVLEVGMGGEWDSTNVADGDVAVFTPVALDHTDRLGNTIAEIAKTKAGIIKPNALVVSSAQPEDARGVIADRADHVAESFKIYGKDFEAELLEVTPLGQRFNLKTLAGEYSDLFMPLHGAHQIENLALAVAAVESFLGGGEQRILDDVLRVAAVHLSSPGRLQVISREPLTILDAAHNPHGAKSLVAALSDSFALDGPVGVLAVLGDKDVDGVLAAFKDVFADVYITQSSSPRATPAAEIAEAARQQLGATRIHVISDLALALAEAEATAVAAKSAVVVTGSITLVGDVLKLKQEEAEQDA